MAGYTRQSAASIANGQIIEDYHFNNEFNQLEAAFSGSTGHAHDGSVGNGPKISLTASVDGVLPVANGGTGVTTLQGLNDALTSGSVFKDNTFIIADFADTTKRFRFEVSAVSSATTRTFTLPDTDITISSYMGGLLNTANKADLQDALDIKTGGLPISTISGLQSALDSKLNLSGGTMTGRLELPATSAAGGMFNINTGTEGPSSPIPGDVWISGDTLYFRGTSATRALGSTGALSTVSQSEAETGTSTTTRAWTAQRVNQAIQALSPVKSVNGKTGAVVLNTVDVGADLLSGFRNKVINGNFDIWQRGANFNITNSGTYTADRWRVYGTSIAAANITMSREEFVVGQEDVPGNPKYFLRLAKATDNGNDTGIEQRIEDVTTLSGKVATLTFYIKGTVGKDITIKLTQNFGTGDVTEVFALNETITLQSTWTKHTFAVSVPSVAGQTINENGRPSLRPQIVIPASSGAVTIDIARVSLVEGDATVEDDPFSPRHIQQEMALCQRYFTRINGNTQWIAGLAAASAGLQVFFALNIPVTMRATPTAGGGGQGSYFTAGGWVSSNMDVASVVGTTAFTTIDVPSATPSGGTPGWLVRMADGNGNPAYITLDAEL